MLAIISVGLVIIFGGHVESLIPLYALGVYTAFTLSQTGMVHHWYVEGGEGWRRSAFFNGLGAVATGIVVVVFAIAKFTEGAWVIIVVVPILVALMLFVRREYDAESAIGMRVEPGELIGPPRRRRRVFIAATSLSRAVIPAVKVARAISTDVSVVHVTDDAEEGERLRKRFEEQVPGVGSVIVESPYRSLVNPFVRYLEVAQQEDPKAVIVVLIPEHVPRHWWDRLLYNQDAKRLRAALVGRRDIDVLDVPYRGHGAPELLTP